MDEDEWTEQNFGGNSLVLNENTSEDSVSDLDSDEEGDEDDEDQSEPDHAHRRTENRNLLLNERVGLIRLKHVAAAEARADTHDGEDD